MKNPSHHSSSGLLLFLLQPLSGFSQELPIQSSLSVAQYYAHLVVRTIPNLAELPVLGTDADPDDITNKDQTDITTIL